MTQQTYTFVKSSSRPCGVNVFFSAKYHQNIKINLEGACKAWVGVLRVEVISYQVSIVSAAD